MRKKDTTGHMGSLGMFHCVYSCINTLTVIYIVDVTMMMTTAMTVMTGNGFGYGGGNGGAW